MRYRDTPRNLSRRASDVGFAALLILIGVKDLLDHDESPHELGEGIGHIVHRVYGLYVIVGCVLIIAAIVGWRRTWARRVERAGLLLTFLATTFLLGYLLIDAQESAGIIANINIYRANLLTILAVASVTSACRYAYLRHIDRVGEIV